MKRSERLQRKKTEADLRSKMARMVEELNSLRDEAAEKMYDVPKSYKLVTIRDEVHFWLMTIATVICVAGFLMLFMWGSKAESTIQAIVAALCLVAWFVAALSANSIKNRPFKVEESVRDYYVNEPYYCNLEKELARIKAGIADYNRQYDEQEKYIRLFAERCPEVEDFGRLCLVLKANDFHAQIKMATAMDDVNCRLDFNETGYAQLTGFIEFFNRGASA